MAELPLGIAQAVTATDRPTAQKSPAHFRIAGGRSGDYQGHYDCRIDLSQNKSCDLIHKCDRVRTAFCQTTFTTLDMEPVRKSIRFRDQSCKRTPYTNISMHDQCVPTHANSKRKQASCWLGWLLRMRPSFDHEAHMEMLPHGCDSLILSLRNIPCALQPHTGFALWNPNSTWGGPRQPVTSRMPRW